MMMSSLRDIAARTVLISCSSYLALVVGNLFVLATTPHPKNPAIGLKGMCSADEVTGYRLTPLWEGVYDDGFVDADIKINLLGHRDEEPGANENRVLLLGDSFAFGALLPQAETIDKHIEDISAQRVDAYNMGVGGYGPPAILATFARGERIRGRWVVYLFFNNDLRSDNLASDPAVVCVDGYQVPARKDSGERFSRTELQEKIREKLTPPPPRTLFDVIALEGIRTKLTEDPESRVRHTQMLSGGRGAFETDGVAKAVGYTLEMQKLARMRGMPFQVMVLPTKGEAMAGRYSTPTQFYVDALRTHDVDAIELVGRLSSADYYEHDLHFNRHGSRIVAAAILESLPDAHP